MHETAGDMRKGDVMKCFRYLFTGVCTGVIVVLLVPVAVCGICAYGVWRLLNMVTGGNRVPRRKMIKQNL